MSLSASSTTSRTVSIPSPERVHLTALDGVRGLAILVVMLMHSLQVNLPGSGTMMSVLRDTIGLGNLGVDLFFVLSGFLITGILIDTRRDQHFFRNFYVRRTLRIFPLYYGLLLVLAALTPIFHFRWQGMFPWLVLYVQNFKPVIIRTLNLEPGHIALYQLWSLAVEEQFYLIWPLIVYMLSGKRRSVAIAAALLSSCVVFLRFGLVFSGRGIDFIHVGMFTRADQLLFGAILATLYRSRLWWPRVLAIGPWLLAGASLTHFTLWLLTDRFEKATPYYTRGLKYTVFAIGCVGLMAWALKPESVCQRVMQTPSLRLLGKYSYGLYLIHAPIFSCFSVPMRFALRGVLHSTGLAFAITLVALFGASLVLAWLSFRFFEKPFLNLKRYFDYSSILPARIS